MRLTGPPTEATIANVTDFIQISNTCSVGVLLCHNNDEGYPKK